MAKKKVKKSKLWIFAIIVVAIVAVAGAFIYNSVRTIMPGEGGLGTANPL